MSEFDQNIPDDLWRKTFEDAAETPPPRVWDAVERRLDESNEPKILPLWGAGLGLSRPFVWGTGIAATVALLLIGWWTLRTTPSELPIARRQSQPQAERVAIAPDPSVTERVPTNPLAKQTPEPSSASAHQASETVVLNQQSVPSTHVRPDPLPAQPANQSTTKPIAIAPTMSAPTLTTPQELAGEKRSSEPQLADVQPVPVSQQPVAGAQTNELRLNRVKLKNSETVTATPGNTLTSAGKSGLPVVTLTPAATGQALSFELLNTSALRLRGPGSIQRIVWLSPAEPTESVAVRPSGKKREVWASVSLMPGAFNPSVAVRSAQPSFTKANTNTLNNTNPTQPSVNSRANFSMAYQAGAGVQLNEHWSVESGVGYLAGRSTVESPVQTSVANFQSTGIAPSAYSGQNSNLYVDALRSRAFNPSAAADNSIAGFSGAMDYSRYSTQNNSYNPQTRQSLSNDYQFVQVPVQVSYQLRPRKRLGLALLGGFLSNIFVRNTVGNELVISAKDGVYRPVSWAATMGARFRYRPSRQWSASLAGVYQPSLGLSTRPESAVQSRPTLTGLSFGIDYHF